MNQLIIIDPTSKIQSPEFFALLKRHDFIEEFSLFGNQPDPSELILTHPVLRFRKPNRNSKTGVFKPEQDYFLVYDPIPLGKGAYGAVHYVLGTWHEDTSGNWLYKTKPHGGKRVIKTNLGFNYIETSHPDAYNSEYSIGHHIPHMGYKYPPTHFDVFSALVMWQQPGISLRSLLRRKSTRAIHLSTADRLRISVNLLQAVEEQAHGIRPQGDAQIIIHQDIKPGNTMIGADQSVRLIDYGLAKLSGSKSTRIRGTPLYMDLRILEQKMVADQSTDLFSLYRTIAELWGDTSRRRIDATESLYDLNVDNTLINLFKGIELLPEEESVLRSLIPQMTQYDESLRPKRVDLLQQFEDLLENRLIYDEVINANHAQFTPLMELRSTALFNVLQSKHALTLIHRFKEKPECLPIVFKKLRSRITKLSPEVLSALHQSGLSFAKPRLLVSIIKNIKNWNLNSAQFMHLIRLGLPVDDDLLREWLHKVNPKNQEHKWVMVCRVLYQSLPNASQIIDEQTIIDPFKALFCRYYLTQSATDELDRQNTRIVISYLQLSTPRKGVELINGLRSFLSPHSPLFALIQNDFLQINQDQLALKEDSNLNDIYRFLMKLVWMKNKTRVPIIQEMPNRTESIKKIEDELNALVEALNSLPHPITNVATMYQTWAELEYLEQIHRHLSGFSPIVQDLDNELDQFYQWPLFDSMILKIRFSDLLEGYNHYHKIEYIYGLMQATEFSFPATSPIVQEFQSLSQLSRLSQAEQFNQRAQACKELYSLVYEALNSFKAETKSTCRGATRQFFFRKLSKLLLDHCSNLRSEQSSSFAFAIELINTFELSLLGQIDTYPRAVFFIYGVLNTKMTDFDSLKNLPISFFEDLFLLGEIDTFLKRLINAQEAVNYKKQLSQSLWNYFSCDTEAKDLCKQNILALLRLPITIEKTPFRNRFHSPEESKQSTSTHLSPLYPTNF